MTNVVIFLTWSLTREPGREFCYLHIQLPPQPAYIPRHKNETWIWLKLDQILSLLVSAHASFASAALGLNLLPGHTCSRAAPQGHSLAFRAVPGTSLHPCSEHSSSTGTCSLKTLENKVQMYWDEHSELGSNAWVMLAVELLLGFRGRNALTPHYGSGFRVTEQEEAPNFAINCCFYH